MVVWHWPQSRMNSDSYRCKVLFLVSFTQLSPSECAASYSEALVPAKEVRSICQGKQQPVVSAWSFLGGTWPKGTAIIPREQNPSESSGFGRCRREAQEGTAGDT